MAKRGLIAVIAISSAFLLAPTAQAASGCPKQLPAKVKAPSSELGEFERRAYVDVSPRRGAKLRKLKVRLAFKAVTVARGSLDGKIDRKQSVPLELLEPLEADRTYEIVTSGRTKGCGGRESTSKAMTLTDAGGGGGGGGGGGIPGQPGANVQGLVIDWSGGGWQGNDEREVNLPGIGRGLVACRPDTQWIRVIPDDPSRETAIVAWTYRRWDDAFEEGSVQEASTNQFGGAEFNLGFNKFGPTPEARSRGTLTGVISDRLPFGAGTGLAAPATAVELSWQWDFREGPTSFCKIEANFTSEAAGADPPVARSLVVNWRGEENALASGAAVAEIPGLGNARVDCQPTPTGIRRFTLFSEPGAGPASFTAYEGAEVRTSFQSQGPYRYDLPNNGLVVADVGTGGKLFLSSRWKANDPAPDQNWCHLAGVLALRGV